MKTLGLIGITRFSTSVYYETINRLVNERLGGAHSAKILLYSMNFGELKTLMEKDHWERIQGILSDIARRHKSAGADCIVICSNTPHLVADEIRRKIQIPLLHIAEETAKEIVESGAKKVELLGTKFTMENSFFRDRLAEFGVETITPGEADRDFIHASIFDELTNGIFKTETKTKYLEIIEKLRGAGERGVVFGCTEIPLLIEQSECDITVFDTTAIHSKAAVDFALSSSSRPSSSSFSTSLN
jgi:aspartate racemase